jgi:hypothetical protein
MARKHLSTENVEKSKGSRVLERSFAILGPGLWIALITFPLMAAIQLMCVRLGIVTGRGLAAAVRMYYPRWVPWGACSILVVANVINICADLGGMAEATQPSPECDH